ncbi:hypothetical protein BB561_005717 [Smittium simulii]|uniref:Uncharacterized protein n=1 Tax=Smittium simulii TaxID=133385 RepID=A0A2T9Y8T9_9FUNG|nr:hypothetical protein BB561_005717 [Smittium simulii]
MSFGAASRLALCRTSHFSTRAALRTAEKTTLKLTTPKPAKRPVGGFRGGVFGFILGAAVTGTYGLYHLVEQYEASNALVLSSVNELEKSTVQIRDYIERIDALEAQLVLVNEQFVQVSKLESFSGDVRRQLDLINKEYLETKSLLSKLENQLALKASSL